MFGSCGLSVWITRRGAAEDFECWPQGVTAKMREHDQVGCLRKYAHNYLVVAP
jgi:hypothetical protein